MNQASVNEPFLEANSDHRGEERQRLRSNAQRKWPTLSVLIAINIGVLLANLIIFLKSMDQGPGQPLSCSDLPLCENPSFSVLFLLG
jgi:hypothetical protein